jgi:transaldolase
MEKLKMYKVVFHQMLHNDPMASEKLKEGIQGFTKALETLEHLLANRLSGLQDMDYVHG